MKEHPNLKRKRNLQILKDYAKMKRAGEKNIHALLSIKYDLSVSRMPQIIRAMTRRINDELTSGL